MFRFLRHSRFRLPRLPALALLLLAVLANPVLASLGDLHELGSGGAGHLHAVTEHGGAAPDHGHPDDEDDGSLLHALMHASHCCGHLTAILPAMALLLSPVSAGAAPAAGLALPPHGRLESLLRPPIAA